jgi:hypothetical protein
MMSLTNSLSPEQAETYPNKKLEGLQKTQRRFELWDLDCLARPTPAYM